MDLNIRNRVKAAWNAFLDDRSTSSSWTHGSSYGDRPDRVRLTRGNERSIVTSVFNRIAIDVASINVRNVILDENGCFVEEVDSGLNECLKLEANVDQTGRALIMDIVMSMLDEGSVAVVPVDVDVDPSNDGKRQILSLRAGRIVEWMPRHVRVDLYNEATGQKQQIVVPKATTAIIENPLYAVINQPNSTMQRLIRKLNLLDVVDNQIGSDKLDLIIQVPYAVKTERKRQMAQERLSDIEQQLSGSRYGIAYVDNMEHVTQLNRPIENNLLRQVEYLTAMVYSQLGITQGVMDGTANEATMLNYYNTTVETILLAICEEFKRKFLSREDLSEGQSVEFFRDPFRLIPLSQLAEIVDKFSRNEVMFPNEIRGKVGLKPSSDPKANELRNRNIAAPAGEAAESEEQIQNG